MALTRLYCPDNLQTDLALQLNEEQARYVGRVLRLKRGDSLAVFNGEQGEFEATIAEIRRSSAVLVIGRQKDSTTESPLKVHLVQGVSRGERMDFVVQKATELGVKRITPVLTEYSVVKLDPARAAKRRDHWQRVAASACEQSGRIRPPLIDTPLPLNSWMGQKTADADVDLILHPAMSVPMSSITAPKTKLCFVIGPEGGFSDAELDVASIAGFKAVSLGPRILRTETAALAAITVAQALWGDLSLS